MLLRGLSRKNRKAIKLMKQNGFSIIEDATKYYLKKNRMMLFNMQSDPFKIFKLFRENPGIFEECGLEDAGIYALPFNGEELDTSYLKFK